MDGFCGSEFWNVYQTVNTTNPDLSDCFQHTVLTWAPCAFICFLTPLQLYHCINSREIALPWRWLNVSKLILCLLLSVDAISLLAYNVYLWSHNGDQIHTADFVYPLMLCLSKVNLLALIYLCQRRGLITSGIIFLSWLIFVVCGIPELKSRLENAANNFNDDKAGFILYLVRYAMLLFSLVLSAFADKRSSFAYSFHKNMACPEFESSFLSQLTFWWFTSLTMIGWKRALVHADLWNLNFRDSSKRLVPLWEKYWNAAMEKFKLRHIKNGEYEQEVKFKKLNDKIELADSKDARAKKASPPSIGWALFRCFKWPIAQLVCLKFICDTLNFVNPNVLSLVIRFVEDPTIPVWRGYFYAALMFVTAECYSLLLHQYMHRVFTVSMDVRTTLTSAVYNKSLRLSNASRKQNTVGEIVNLMAVDVERIVNCVFYMNSIYYTPYQVILSLVFLWQQLGPSVLAGFGIMVLILPLNYLVGSFQRKFQVVQMKHKDSRLKLMNEILNGMKILKLYGWEPSYEKIIVDIRQKELNAMRKGAIMSSVTNFLWISAPFLVSVLTFAVYVLSDPTHNILTPEKAFVSLALFNILRFPLTVLPMTITFLIQASVSNTRLKKFLAADEIDPFTVTHNVLPSSSAVHIEDGNFSWEKGASPTLKKINLTVKPGSLTAVVGSVGCGKSSLLSAILGEMDKESGTITTNGTVAYVPQMAWIRNTTLRNNVTFLKDYNEAQYRRVINACALQPDFDILPGGDATEIGEKGINLSGGQKQRVSLARAVYQDLDVYLLDDPLSAVDSHVGKHIFDEVISSETGLLKNKTRILVTHGLKYLKHADQIVVIKDGSISELGTFDDLLRTDGAFAEFLRTYLEEAAQGHAEELENDKLSEKDDEEETLEQLAHQLDSIRPGFLQRLGSHFSESSEISLMEPETTDQRRHSLLLGSLHRESMKRQKSKVSQKADTEGKKKDQKLIEKEQAETGNVSLNVYNMYLRACGYIYAVFVVLQYGMSSAMAVGSNIWLSEWSNSESQRLTSNSNSSDDTAMRLGVYATLGIGQGLFVMTAALTFSMAYVIASTRLHRDMLHNIMRWPMAAFDVTPLGRIVNRLGKDMEVVDNTLPVNLRSWIQNTLTFLGTIAVIIFSTPTFAAVIVPLSVVYYFVQRFYVATNRQLKRLESISKSPIYSHFQETVQGASSIRAYKAQNHFITESDRLVDLNQMCNYPMICSNRWLAIRLEFVGNAIVLFAALFAVIARDSTGISAGVVGLSVSYAMNTTQTLTFAVRITSDVEANVVAVERIKEYSEKPEEAPYESSNPPAKNWPDVGAISFQDYALRYREQLELVLHGISFSIKGCEKIGIVGRTGAGKSSVTLALFRLIEAAQGRIVIDGIDVSKIGLHELRNRLTIIPQDPVLFSGTLRMNLDPLGRHSDVDLWSALEHSHLKEYVRGLPTKLEHPISEGGENLSVGQRQLVCLARALLRKTKILVLDEATAAVDMETDDLIQKTIRQEFTDCTILTIAHRLHTIMDSTRVLVLDKGRVVEFDQPSELLRNKNSVFYGMAADAGIVST